jgi:hypothetical protein
VIAFTIFVLLAQQPGWFKFFPENLGGKQP